MAVFDTLIQTQQEYCHFYKADFFPLENEQLVVVSDGVYQGDAVDGVRYQSPKHMTGWWITTDRYNGDVDSVWFDEVMAKEPS